MRGDFESQLYGYCTDIHCSCANREKVIRDCPKSLPTYKVCFAVGKDFGRLPFTEVNSNCIK